MIKYLSLFSGIGAFEKALENLGIKYELINYCEIDKYASKAYSLIHSIPESKNLGDITMVDEKLLPIDIDLLTYGFPCQDISIAGRKKKDLLMKMVIRLEADSSLMRCVLSNTANLELLLLKMYKTLLIRA